MVKGDGDGETAESALAALPVPLGRAFAGALIFSLPMLMTMEMWSLGASMDPFRLALLLGVSVPLLIGLGRIAGFRETSCWSDDIADAFVAMVVATVTAIAILAVFGALGPGMSAREMIGKVALQAVPGSIGALLARSQLGQESPEDGEPRSTYFGEVFLMAVGALFLSFNMAPTEEIMLISYGMGAWQKIALILASLAIMHIFVYEVGFSGQEAPGSETGGWSLFARFSVVGYCVVLAVSLAVLWIFGRTDGLGLEQLLGATIVLAFPGAIGAAAARLIL
ncbi:TIGR02587 family membrane protein [Rhodospirillum rubrum]|uniref:Integral membrane protein TIGR02587 n=2 Tax=Rhodospirillum rubrum TaxID=1085 RepID=Q2RSV4_RHORT|nr:TIGR02587 family membrane protein [Rhodospirillum rubrum]ABC22791.1 conserved hypothetical protein [Rhodospirillum rubrum ATCC 11170]AEO48512.1 hypothetical protein F11_10230 [Rhodospirillum rubrum F11]MBK5954388.1 TIGR02587 family membrane protein [Rhodospirillum rubrum]QXG78780.1 TIGR02587 family membrane protein [Rhodospirillum rubrum]HAP98467.1 TIGR02587 family membrane protein [Rhodospirillum rubrum]